MVLSDCLPLHGTDKSKQSLQSGHPHEQIPNCQVHSSGRSCSWLIDCHRCTCWHHRMHRDWDHYSSHCSSAHQALPADDPVGGVAGGQSWPSELSREPLPINAGEARFVLRVRVGRCVGRSVRPGCGVCGRPPCRFVAPTKIASVIVKNFARPFAI